MSEVDPILLSIEGDASGADEALGSFDEMLAGVDAAAADLEATFATLDAAMAQISAMTAEGAASFSEMDASIAGVDASLSSVGASADAAAAGLDAAAISADANATALDSGAVAADANAASTNANTAAVDTNTTAKDANAASTGKLNMLLLAAGVAIAAAGIGAIKAAGDFQSGMTTLVTGAGEAQSNIKLVSAGILQMSVDTATSTKDLTDGMFMIESAGFHGAAGLKVLQAAAEGAKVGNADLASVANGVTTEMTDYASSNLSATDATNILIAAVANGKTHMQDLANSMASILPTASVAKVSLIDVQGAMATMTGEGVPAANAATYLRQTLLALDAPSKQTVNALASVGLKSSDVAAEMQKSLPDALKMITDAVGKKFPVGSAAYVNAIKDIAGGSKQMQGILDLTGDHMKTYQGNVKSITDAVNKGKGGIAGWADVQKDLNFKVDQAKQAVGKLFIELGTNLMPLAANFASWITSTAVPALQNFATFLGKNHDVMVIVAAVIGGVLAAAIWSLVAPLLAAAVAAAPLVAVFVGIALVAALIITHWKQVAPIFQAIGNVIGPVANAIKQSLGDAFKALGDALKDAQPAFQDLLKALAPALPILKGIAVVIGGALLLAIGFVIGGIRGFIGAFKGIIEVVTGVINFIHGFIDVIVGVFTGNGDKVKGGLKQMLSGLLGVFKGIFDAITGFIGGWVDGILGFFNHLTGGALSKVIAMKNNVVGVFKSLTGAIDGSTKEAQLKAGMHTDEMKIKTITNAEDMEKKSINHIENMKKGILQQLAETKDPAKRHALEMKLNHLNQMEEMHRRAVDHMEKMKKKTLAHMEELKREAKHHAELMKMGVIGHIIELAEDMGPKIAKGISDFLGKIGDFKDKVIQKIKDMAKGITDEIGKLPAQLLDLGGKIIQGLIDGIKGAVGGIGNALGGVKDAVVGGVKNLFGIHSPSKLMADEVGGPLADGILLGMTKGVANIKGSANALLKGIIPTVNVGAVGTTATLSGNGSSNQVVSLLTQILQVLQGQRGPQTANIGGVSTSSTHIGSISINGGGGGNASHAYQLMNQISGLAQENATRGAVAGIGLPRHIGT